MIFAHDKANWLLVHAGNRHNSDVKDQSTNVEWFRTACPYIAGHRGSTMVFFLSGATIAHREFDTLVADLRTLHSLGVRLVICFGARPQLDHRLDEADVVSHFHRDQRISGRQIVQHLVEEAALIRTRIESRLAHWQGAAGAGPIIDSGNYVVAEPYGIIDGVDHKLTGRPRRIRSDSLRTSLDNHRIVLLPPFGYSRSGKLYNLNAIDIAAEVASSLRAEKLLLLQRKPLPDSLPSSLLPNEYRRIPRFSRYRPELQIMLDRANTSVIDGTVRAHLLSVGDRDALLTELFTNSGSGVLLTADRYKDIRQAKVDDVSAIHALTIEPAENGKLRQRNKQDIASDIGSYRVLLVDGRIVACVAITVSDKGDHAELSCLVVDPQHEGHGYAQDLCAFTEDFCRERGVSRLYALTTRASDLFELLGFRQTKKNAALPQTIAQHATSGRNSRVYLKPLR